TNQNPAGILVCFYSIQSIQSRVHKKGGNRKTMQSTRLDSGLGHRRVGLRIALGALGVAGMMVVLVLSLLGSAEPFATEAGASARSMALERSEGDAAYSLASAANLEVSGSKFKVQSQNLEPGTLNFEPGSVCGPLSFLQAVNY